MSRVAERIIDLIATATLLFFAYLLREGQPSLAGAVVMAAISFWLNKNASSPDSPAHLAAAAAATLAAELVTATQKAAAEVLRTAIQAAEVHAAAAGTAQASPEAVPAVGSIVAIDQGDGLRDGR